MQERIKKGLCFKCGEKWSKEHKCKTGQVFMIVDTSDDEGAENSNGGSDDGVIQGVALDENEA